MGCGAKHETPSRARTFNFRTSYPTEVGQTLSLTHSIDITDGHIFMNLKLDVRAQAFDVARPSTST